MINPKTLAPCIDQLSPKIFFKNDLLASELNAAIKVLQSARLISKTETFSLEFFKNCINDKKKFIRDLSEDMFFLVIDEKFSKNCNGHDIRISDKRYVSEKKANKFAENRLKEYYQKHPEIKQVNFYLQKHRGFIGSSYNIRIHFFHFDDSPSCNYPAVSKKTTNVKCVLDVLNSFETKIMKEKLNLEMEYSVLFDLIFS